MQALLMERDVGRENPLEEMRIRQEDFMYRSFLSFNYKIYHKYCELRQIFLRFSFSKTAEQDREHEQQLKDVNETINLVKNIIKNLENKSERLLCSD